VRNLSSLRKVVVVFVGVLSALVIICDALLLFPVIVVTGVVLLMYINDLAKKRGEVLYDERDIALSLAASYDTLKVVMIAGACFSSTVIILSKFISVPQALYNVAQDLAIFISLLGITYVVLRKYYSRKY